MTLIIQDKIIACVSGRAVPKLANDQNTDDIMPARFLKEITFARMGEYVYTDERMLNGRDHPFNDSRYAGAKILLVGNNFGCGSSREHAPQGLYRWGIRAIVAEGFAEIFAGNCAAIGIVPVTASINDIRGLAQLVGSSPEMTIDVDLCRKELVYWSKDRRDLVLKPETPLGTFNIDLPDGRRQAFLNGTWDAMAVLQANQERAEQVRQRLPYLQ
jgi:3-isopropylmalate/(R)-2-methylmalate dehydratase small subunit